MFWYIQLRRKEACAVHSQNDEPPEMIRRFWNIWIFYEYFILNYKYNVLQRIMHFCIRLHQTAWNSKTLSKYRLFPILLMHQTAWGNIELG